MTLPSELPTAASEVPDKDGAELLESLRSRVIDLKFLYKGEAQVRKWVALHQAFSPSRTDPDCSSTYEAAFSGAASVLQGPNVNLISLGCGAGHKDARCLKILHESGVEVFYTPVDVSAEMVTLAQTHALAAMPSVVCSPLVCDLSSATEVSALVNLVGLPGSQRLTCCFGMLPGFEPDTLLPGVSALLRGDDLLLCSANLAPGTDYTQGVRQVLPLYDNTPTRDWLMSFLAGVGIAQSAGRLVFEAEEGRESVKRIVARFTFACDAETQVRGERIEFKAGESIRVFFSYRHTPELVRRLLEKQGLAMLRSWITASGDEGVFLATRLATR